MSNNWIWLLVLACSTIGCGGTSTQQGTSPASAAQAVEGQPPASAQPKQAQVGQPAPDFALPNLKGELISLSQYKGKVVVLEWFNPKCSMAEAAYEREFSLKGKAAALAQKGVVWLAINSQPPGADGHSVEENKSGRDTRGLAHPILRDESGKVGKLYGAVRTPHLFLIDAEGTLVYRGAIDNTAGGDLDDAVPPLPINFVDLALSNVQAQEPVLIQQTNAWG